MYVCHMKVLVRYICVYVFLSVCMHLCVYTRDNELASYFCVIYVINSVHDTCIHIILMSFIHADVYPDVFPICIICTFVGEQVQFKKSTRTQSLSFRKITLI